ncbi:hypothetical protein DFH06DRAFT_1477337 [Mycena polygramma]|nr:hypothetical protein DFH06DRAFT_1477337 [Mycena polygramma]
MSYFYTGTLGLFSLRVHRLPLQRHPPPVAPRGVEHGDVSLHDLRVNGAVVGLSPARIILALPSLETTRWAPVACALLFFGYFGFADEAIKNYRGAFWSVVKRVGYTNASFGSGGTSLAGATSKQLVSSGHGRNATLPAFIRKETAQKRDSFDSFSDLSASYGALDYADGDKEKEKEKGGSSLTMGDVGGMLPDYKESDYSTSPTSTDSTPSTGSPISSDAAPSRPVSPSSPSPSPSPSHAQEDTEDIEVSSLHRASVYGGNSTLAPPSLPEAARTHTRRAADVPMSAINARDGADIV